MFKKSLKTGMFIYIVLVILLAIFPAANYNAIATLLAILPLGFILGGFWFAVDYCDIPRTE